MLALLGISSTILRLMKVGASRRPLFAYYSIESEGYALELKIVNEIS